MSDNTSIDASLLLDIDITAVSTALNSGISEVAENTILKLEELDKIDWGLAASGVLGITDPIGQLREWLAGVLSGFVDTIKRAFEAIISPIRSAIDTILSGISTIRDAFATLINMVKSVVVTPILDALNWVSTTLPRLVDIASSALSAFAKARIQ